MTSGEPRHILVAEDDDANRALLQLYLEKRGFSVTAVTNGLEVLEALDRGTFDLVLLDWMMPVLSGIDALARLRASHPELPVIMLTAVGGTTDVVGALELGADDYVTKPYELPVLMARIEARLRRRERLSAPVTVAGGSDVGPGLVIDERYELIEQIGAGAFGVVYRARHKTLETEFAIKVLRTVAASGTELLTPIDSRGRPQGKAISAEQAEEFRREGVRACRVQHPNAVRVFDYGALPFGPSYLVMELLRGRTLDDELHEQRRLSVRRAVEVLVPVCQALVAAHDQHVIHRDIKPQNIFLHQTAAGEVVKVLDFGVAKLTDTGEAATRDAIAGSPAYMAPERLRGRPYDGRSDVYAVGITLYELLTGEVPFRSDNSDVMAVALMQLRDEPVPPSEVEPSLPKALDARVLELLAKEPAKRPTAAQAVERLHDLLDAVA